MANTNYNSIGDSPIIWPAKFVIMVIAEENTEAPSEEETMGFLESAFPNLSTSDFANLHSFVVKAHGTCSNSKEEWDKVWDTFLSQLQTFKISETFSAMKEIAHIYWLFKMEESMNEVMENFTYRMSQYEQYLQISKSDYRSILEEAKEITGYNQFNEDN
jgi:hypothetical protein